MIKIFDTTLRDGEQAPGCSMNIEEKIEIALQLEKLGVDCIEAGFAICSEGDFNSVASVAKVIKNCSVASLARATTKDIDRAYEAVKRAVSPKLHIFIATSPIHMKHKLNMEPHLVLEMVERMTKYAKQYCSEIEFSAEDATRSEPQFLAKVLETAIASGATVVNVPDTVGYTTPIEMFERIKYLMENVKNIEKVDVSLHCHNDLGMAVANSLAGIRAGATQIECTVNGLGERAGNAALEEVVMAIATRRDLYDCSTSVDTKQIWRTSRLVYNTIGQLAPLNKAVVGSNAFLHESGIHQHGVMKEPTTYEIMTPDSIGLHKTNLLLGKHSGKHAFVERITELGYSLNADEIELYFDKFKQLCDKKKTISDSDLEAILSNKEMQNGTYKLDTYDVHSGKNASAVSVIRLRKDDELFEEVSLGDGPIDAAYNAIDKIVNIGECELVNYSINSIDDGKDALGDVVVKLRSGDKHVTGRGLSTDIIESSILAYINGINKLYSIADKADNFGKGD